MRSVLCFLVVLLATHTAKAEFVFYFCVSNPGEGQFCQRGSESDKRWVMPPSLSDWECATPPTHTDDGKKSYKNIVCTSKLKSVTVSTTVWCDGGIGNNLSLRTASRQAPFVEISGVCLN